MKMFCTHLGVSIRMRARVIILYDAHPVFCQLFFIRKTDISLLDNVRNIFTLLDIPAPASF